MYDVEKIRADFPILSRKVYGNTLVYLDNSATAQKPRQVIEAISNQYQSLNANVHRGVHYLSEQATELYEDARRTVQRFIGAASPDEIVFTRGTTEGINLVASSLCEATMREGDEILVTEMEHHSNIVPWQLAARRHGLRLRVVPITDSGEIQLEQFEQMIADRTRLISVAHVSNVLGTVNPVKEMTRIAHAHNVPILIDGAQSVPHRKVDVADIGCDFLCFSGHKAYGPTGIGVLYGKSEWLKRMPPYQGGGEMIDHVSFSGTTFLEPPLRFEAGTPNYVGAHALAVAINYLSAIGMDNINAYERQLTAYALDRLKSIEGLRLFGTAAEREGVFSFLVGNIHHLDMGTLLDRLGIAVRTGHHCAEPLMHRLSIEGTVRASIGLYTTRAEIDALVDGIERVRKMF